MKLLFSNDWLRRKIATDPDVDVEAGPPLSGSAEDEGKCRSELQAENVAVIGDRNAVQLRVALGILVHQLRLKAGLSIAELAERAQVTEDELRQVEHDPHYTARPRLIYQLSEYFTVSLSTLSQMSGATHSVNRQLYNTAVKYAARSDDVSTLTNEEREALDTFVAMLNERSQLTR
ncbi:MAG: helix-turn-helix domain-containing protein [Acidobacteriaceae bacterium]